MADVVEKKERKYELKDKDVAISIRGLRKVYKTAKGEQIGVKKLDLEIPAGLVLGLVGGNGAGKSTSIKATLGLILPTEGEIFVHGYPAGSRAACSLLGYLPEVATYHEYAGAKELLKIHAELAGVDSKDISARCDEVLEQVGLGGRANSRIKEFSKGMKQRFGIAQAIIGDPPILILDELTSGLDPIAQASLIELVKGFSEQGKTIIFSSHHMREVEQMAEKVAFMHRGELKIEGTLDEILTSEDAYTIKIKGDKEGIASLELDSKPTLTEGIYTCEVTGEKLSKVVETIQKSETLQMVDLRQKRDNLDQYFYKFAKEEGGQV